MATALVPLKHSRCETVADLLRRLGNIPARRVWLDPPPGTATEKDLTALNVRKQRLFELVEGTLVEKPMGYEESHIALVLGSLLLGFVNQHGLGIVTGADGPLRLAGGLVRLPDVAFVAWSRIPGRKWPRQAVPGLAPDLAVEILSKGNTKGEMARKLREYFDAGTRLVWIVDPKTRTVRVHTSPAEPAVLTEGQTLEGGAVLPGFRVPVARLFVRAGT